MQIKILVLSHPGCATFIGANALTSLRLTNEVFGTIWGSNDCPDAFRHALYNALNAKSCGEELAREFGEAHECENGPDLAAATAMDFHNNNVGYSIHNSNPNDNVVGLAAEVCEALEVGDLMILQDVSNTATSWLVPSNTRNCSCD